ncbi:MAG: histidine phosphatase family protein [Bacteroidales bacterium]|nr:histidine phosphatase family protein [Bacteroidales bacterium]
MKELHIVRHGKSSWDYSDVMDEDRPLTERGIHNAYTMAERILNKGYKPELIISSPANRALYTAIIFSKTLGISFKSFQIDDRLYLSYQEEILKVLHSVDESINSLMIFGHNPSFTSFANQFVKNTINDMPTAAVVSLRFDVNRWNEISKSTRVMEDFDYPRKD